MKKLFLHIGSPKTGTTSIQEYFHQNRENLKQKGIIYPGKEICHHVIFFTSQRDSTSWPRQYNNVDHNTLQNYVTNSLVNLAEDFSKDFNTYIMSTEYLFFSDVQAVHHTVSWLKDFFDEIEIIVFIRQPSKHYSSSQQQVIKASHQIETPSHYYYPFRAVIEAWQSACTVLSVEYSAETNSLQSISEILKIDTKNFKTPKRSNESLSVEQMLAFEKIQKNIYSDTPDVFKKHLRSISNIKPNGLTKPTLKKGIEEYIDQKHKRDLSWLKEKHGIAFTTNQKSGQLPSRLKNMEKCSVKDVYNTNDKKQEKYESILMNSLLKYASKNS